MESLDRKINGKIEQGTYKNWTALEKEFNEGGKMVPMGLLFPSYLLHSFFFLSLRALVLVGLSS